MVKRKYNKRKALIAIFAMILCTIFGGCRNGSGSLPEEGMSDAKQSSDLNVIGNTDIGNTDIENTDIENTDIGNMDAVRIPEAAYGNTVRMISSLDIAYKWGDNYDFRCTDLSQMDLAAESKLRIDNITYDTTTKWPDKLPEGFDPEAIMETGRNPGLGIRNLQEQGITGKGVNIAIIDSTLLLEHEEYSKQIRVYDEVNNSGNAEMHGPYVTSLLAGKSSGVAPDVGLYYYGCQNYNMINSVMELDYTHYANAIDKIIEVNRDLPVDQKIRAISISASWCPDNKGYREITEAIERAIQENIFVVSCNLFDSYGFWQYSLDRKPAADPDDPESYMVFEWKPWTNLASHIEGFIPFYETTFENEFKGEFLLVPIGSRTTAEPTGMDQYCFNRGGGWSGMEPYVTGLYAMACQVKPDITPEEFWETALKTGDPKEVTRGDDKYLAKMLNPVKLIEDLKVQ